MYCIFAHFENLVYFMNAFCECSKICAFCIFACFAIFAYSAYFEIFAYFANLQIFHMLHINYYILDPHVHDQSQTYLDKQI